MLGDLYRVICRGRLIFIKGTNRQFELLILKRGLVSFVFFIFANYLKLNEKHKKLLYNRPYRSR